MTSSVGLVVVGYESEEEWDGFFARVRESTLQPREIVVVDNSPLSPFDPSGISDLPVHVVHLPSNPGLWLSSQHRCCGFERRHRLDSGE